jgi:hypothetical protein
MKRKFLLLLAISTSWAALYAQTGNVGIGTTAPGSKLTVNGSFAANYNNITATTYAMQASDYYVAWNGSTTGTVTLPTALAIGSGNFGGRIYNIKNTSTSSSLTVVAGGAELIDNQSGAGVANISLPPGYYAMIINKGTTTGTTWEVAIVGNSNTVPCSGFGALVAFGTQSIAGGTATKILFPTEEWDQGGVFTPAAASTFTAPQAGRYILTGSYKTGAATAPNSQDLILFKNNAVLTYGTSIGSSTVSNVIGGSVSYIADLAAGDVIDLRIFITPGATTSIDLASFSAIKTDCSGGTASGGSTTTGDYDWMKSGNVAPTSPGDTATNIYHIGGNVGIGTNAPTTIFQAKGAAPQANLTLSTVPLASQFLGLWGMGGTNGTSDYQSAGINANATENWTSTASGSQLAFVTTANSTATRVQRMVIGHDGNAGIFQNGNTGINPLTLLHLRLQSSGGAGVTNTNISNMALRLENFNNGESVIQHFLAKDAAGATKEFIQGINPTFNGGNGAFYMVTGNVGIGVAPATSKLHVIGSVTIADGTQGANKVLTSDANGLASWKDGPMGLFVKSAGTQVWSGAATITDWVATTNNFGSAWNGSVFTVPAGMQGWYTIHTGYQTSANGATARTPFGHIQVMINGTAVVIGTASVHVDGGTVNGAAPGAGSAVASMSYYLNVGDQVSIIGNHLTYAIPANTSTSIAADPVHTYFSILKQ